MPNTKNVEDKLERKKIKRAARKKAAPKAARTTPRGSNKKKAKKLTRGQRNAEFVAKGEADIAVQLSNEIRMVPGVIFIPLPKEFERTFVFSAGLGSRSSEPSIAKAIIG